MYKARRCKTPSNSLSFCYNWNCRDYSKRAPKGNFQFGQGSPQFPLAPNYHISSLGIRSPPSILQLLKLKAIKSKLILPLFPLQAASYLLVRGRRAVRHRLLLSKVSTAEVHAQQNICTVKKFCPDEESRRLPFQSCMQNQLSTSRWGQELSGMPIALQNTKISFSGRNSCFGGQTP